MDSATHQVSAFSLPAGRSLLAAGNGVAYAATVRSAGDANLATVDAYGLATGELFWSWNSPSSFQRSVILTDGLLFLSREYDTVALDIATHEAVWSVPHVGPLAISENGVLYVVNPTGNNYARA